MKTFVFISYARDDAASEAKRIQHLLEHAFIPRSLVSSGRPLPEGRHLRKVFVDTSDLAVSNENFVSSIHKELDAAEYLIVLCSKQSARAESFVHDEIAYFLKGHGGDTSRILPIALDGVNEMSVPAEVRPIVKIRNIPIWSREWHLGRREDKSSENAAYFKILEFIFGIGADVLNNRYWIEWKRKIQLVVGVSFAVLLSMIFLLLYGIVQARERTKFERDVFPKSVDFSYMTAFARPLIRESTNADCIVIAAVPKNYNELANTPTIRRNAILQDAESLGWQHAPKAIPCREKKWGIGTVELTPTNAIASGVSIYVDSVDILSSVKEVVDYLTTSSPYHGPEDRERLAAHYVKKFEECLVEFLKNEPTIKDRKWKYYFVSTREELDVALKEVKAVYSKGGCP